jgi:glyoxylase-like metal-dependent hydrolase (beta-lactamase superfamily II)
MPAHRLDVRGDRVTPLRVAERWFTIDEVDDGVLRVTEPHASPLIRANLFLVRGRDRDLLVDSGLGIGRLRADLVDLFERPVTAVATHRHYDHVGGLHEFEEIVIHRDDAEAVTKTGQLGSLTTADLDPEYVAMLTHPGEAAPDVLIDALPYEGYDPAGYAVRPVTPTRVVEEGDVVTTGDRSFTVLHLPGHTPGEIGLWDAETRTLFSGDCVYESGELLDEMPESSIPDYVASVERLRDVPVRIVHGGHDESFGPDRLHELIELYLERRAIG